MTNLFYALLVIPLGYEVFKLLNASYFIYTMNIAKNLNYSSKDEMFAASMKNLNEFVDQFKFLLLDLFSWILIFIGLFTDYFLFFLIMGLISTFLNKKLGDKKWFVILDSSLSSAIYGYIISHHFSFF